MVLWMVSLARRLEKTNTIPRRAESPLAEVEGHENLVVLIVQLLTRNETRRDGQAYKGSKILASLQMECVVDPPDEPI